MRKGKTSAFLALLVLVGSARCFGGDPIKLHRDEWLGVYIGANKIGYIHTTIEAENFADKNGYRKDEDMSLRYGFGDERTKIDVSYVLHADERFAPIFGKAKWHGQDSRAGASGSPVDWEVSSTYLNAGELLRYIANGRTEEHTMPYQKGLDLAKGCSYDFGTQKLSMGRKTDLGHFRLDGIGLSTSGERGIHLEAGSELVTVSVTGRERTKNNGKIYDAWVVSEKTSRGEVKRWQLDDGEVIKEEHRLPDLVLLVRETPQEAKQFSETDGPDLDVIKSSREIPNCETVREMTVRILGVPGKDVVVSEGRQKATYDAGTQTVECHVIAKQFDQSKSINLPVKDSRYNKWLAGSSAIQVNDPRIRSVARKIVGSEKSAYKAATMLRGYVYSIMTYEENSQKKLSAVDILKTKTGSCAHHSILFAALARAIGIPTRIVEGLCYDGRGHFMFHAWVEAFVGEWVPFDPVFPRNFVSATRVKLYRPEVNDISTGADMERLRAKVQSTLVFRARVDVADCKYLADGSIARGASATSVWQPIDEWMGVYFRGARIGYIHRTVSKETRDAKPGYCEDQLLRVIFRKAGTARRMDARCVLHADESFNPTVIEASMTAKIREGADWQTMPGSFVGEARYGAKEVSSKYEEEGKTTEEKLPLPPAEVLRASCRYALGQGVTEIGDSVPLRHVRLHRFSMMDPTDSSSLDLMIESSESKITAVRREKCEINHKTYDALVLVDRDSDGETTIWMSNTGEILKEEMRKPNLVTFIKETREEVLKIEDTDGPDVSALK